MQCPLAAGPAELNSQLRFLLTMRLESLAELSEALLHDHKLSHFSTMFFERTHREN